MSQTSPPGPGSDDAQDQQFAAWLSARGVEIDGVRALSSPGAGTGIRSCRPLKAGERVVFVPAAALLTADSQLVEDFDLPGSATVHGRLAAALALQHERSGGSSSPWMRTWPRVQDVRRSMPLMWHGRHTTWLSRSAQVHLAKQRAKLDRDWASLHQALGGLSRDLFVYYWLMVNTRCFYWDHSRQATNTRSRKRRKTKRLPSEDCMALCPFADFFNHSSDGLRFASDRLGCHVTCDRDYPADEELFICYGKHSNDFLLAEYGFVLPNNRWDFVSLDAHIMPLLGAAQRDVLDEYNLLGDYTVSLLDGSQVCYRTQAALRVVHLPESRYLQFLKSDDDGESDQDFIDHKCRDVVVKMAQEMRGTLSEIGTRDSGPQNKTLISYYEHAETLLAAWARGEWCEIKE